MEKKEVIAYAITHAPPGVKGGPYEAESGVGRPVPTLTEAWRKRSRVTVRRWLRAVRRHVPTARVIRIVRARPSPSEASAVEVLRALVASWDETGRVREPLFANARCVLAAAGPDPSEVVRAAMRYLDHGDDGRLGSAWVKFREAVDAYRKAGGK